MSLVKLSPYLVSKRSIRPAIDRVMANIQEDENGCWLWPGAKTANGYGRVNLNSEDSSKSHLVHRITYESFVGPIPPGMDVDHLCHTRLCCNPKHLEPVPRKENANRGLKSHRGMLDSCKYGHPYPESAVMTKAGHIYCGECYTPGGRRRDA